MTDSELDKLLKRAEPPQREALYWESFPSRIQSQLGQERPAKAIVDERAQRLPFWSLGFATAGIAIALFFVLHITRSSGDGNEELRVLRNCYRETAPLFSGQLKALKIESGTLRLDLSDKPDVPDSAPLFVRACNDSKCAAAVTFSGQQIELLGHKIEVLADGRGGIMLLTSKGVITSRNPRFAGLGHLEVGWLDEKL